MFRLSIRQLLHFYEPQSTSFLTGGKRLIGSCSIEKQNGYFHLTGKGFESDLSYIWLRDHCRSPLMYNSATHQRNTNILDLKSDVEPLSFQENEDNLTIQWNDGHCSKYSKEWLIQNAPNLQEKDEYEKLKNKIQPWNQDSVKRRDVSVKYEYFMERDDGIRQVLDSLIINGFAMVHGIKDMSLQEGTLATVERMVRIQSNLFGRGFQFSSKRVDDVSDSSYSQDFLLPHNDMTYLTHASGLQVFHPLKESEMGGETILVDGFEIARQFKELCAEGYSYFSYERPVESEYIHKGEKPHEHSYSSDFIFKHYPNSSVLRQVRYNVYDRAPHKGLRTVEEQMKFYEFYKLLSSVFQKPSNSFELKLVPGTLIFIDNFRVLHGRNAFRGSRIMSGCYVERSDFLSQAKVFELI
ncbi:trimethyllysine dioxygenase, mitochondrial [Lepeophtheirus salmonis]|uniref:trimethyllysine dioxygenase, mitochondrial n=1 Tax=Lepeophtheirus salmonis TaxID=72036 RepID=UPI001AE1C25E|nr:trimethyllysine dioxygenase, mitochondrial-like [Lepeophtheirus salmonis]XP_040565119.1 trimethyllysine dioxygenase, mitochondrial-like [Lepeophtheirus salmonis]